MPWFSAVLRWLTSRQLSTARDTIKRFAGPTAALASPLPMKPVFGAILVKERLPERADGIYKTRGTVGMVRLARPLWGVIARRGDDSRGDRFMADNIPSSPAGPQWPTVWRRYVAKPALVAGRFVAEQTRKTVQRPSRLFYVPATLIINPLLPSLAGPLLTLHWLCDQSLRKDPAQNGAVRFVLGGFVRLADSVLERVGADFFFVGGAYALQRNRPLMAWDFFSQGLDKTDDHNYLRTAGATLYVGLGRMREALALQRRADDLRLANAARLGIVQTDLRVLDYLWYAHIGQVP
jgi:hypothetical protein